MLDASNSPIGDLSIALVSDREIARLHLRHMGIPGPTDVITFESPAEVVISLDTAARQAKSRRVGLKDEVAFLLLHGLLHLAGFDDTSPKKWCAMKRAEVGWMGK